MQNLSIDTGVTCFSVNGGDGVLRFNPGDPNLYERFFNMAELLDAMDAEFTTRAAEISAIGDETERARALLSLSGEADRKLKALLGEVFGPENDFDAALGGVSLMAVNGDGERVVVALMNALAPIISAGARRTMEEKVAEAKKGRKKR